MKNIISNFFKEVVFNNQFWTVGLAFALSSFSIYLLTSENTSDLGKFIGAMIVAALFFCNPLKNIIEKMINQHQDDEDDF